jgi:hypothetical protein
VSETGTSGPATAPDAPEDLDSVGSAAGPVPRPAAAVSRQAYDPSRDRETKRGQIAAQLLTLLTVLTLAPFVLALARGLCVRAVADAGACSGFPEIDLMALMQLVFTPVVALVGAATGFYFGEKKG